ncbi:ankyrin repeat and EF-hand domain-containing protein 1 [Aplochiton taeniatus]
MRSPSKRTRTRVAEGRLQVLQIYRLLQQVNEGDKAQIEKMVILGVEDLINLTEPREGTGVLHLASVANNQDLVAFLLSQGARPNAQDKRGRTPVMLAAELGHDGIVALLAKNHADMKLLDAEGKGVLFYCVYPTMRHARCLQAVLHNMADVNNMSAAGVPVFLLMCEQAHDLTPMCLSMLEAGADPNATNEKTGRTVLMEAAKAGSLELVRALLQAGAKPNTLDKNRYSVTHLAAMGGFFEVIQVLSASSAPMDCMTLDCNSPLHYAAAGGHTECCRFLAQRGCNPKNKNQDGVMPRQIAKDMGFKAAAKELRKAERTHGKYSKPGASNPNALWALTLHDWSFEHETALRKEFGVQLETASREEFVSVLQRLEAPVEPDQLHTVYLAHDRKKEGFININEFFKGLKYLQKPFVVASYGPKKKKGKGAKSGKKGKKKGKLTIPMPICVVPSDLLHRRQDGGPPHFMVEAYQHNTDAARFTRDRPPRHPVEDDSAWYVDEPERTWVNVNYCVKTGDAESLRLAFSQGVPVDVKDRYYKTPLMTACSSGNYEMVRFLIKYGADVNMCDQFSWTPLHHAAHGGQVDIVELLVSSGATVDAVALNGATPLMRAVESCRPCCVDFLIQAGANVMAVNKKERSCMDIAYAFADHRIIDLIKAKMESLPKIKETKKGKGGKPQQAKARPATAKEKSASLLPPTPLAAMATKARSLKESESIITHNTNITSGNLHRVDISFVPKTVWGKQPTTSQLIQKKEKRRERFTSDVDFDDFRMPFNQNILRKSLELAEFTA